MRPRYTVNLTVGAAADLSAIHAYIHSRSPQNAASVIARLFDSIDALESDPHRYKVFRAPPKLRRTVRSMPVPPHVVYYEVDDAALTVVVLTVRHGARRKPRL